MNPLRWSFRAAFAFAAFLCAAFLGFAWYAQFRLNLEPCPLCILQRVMVIVLFIVGGPLGWIPLFVLPMMIALGFLLQRPLDRAMKRPR